MLKLILLVMAVFAVALVARLLLMARIEGDRRRAEEEDSEFEKRERKEGRR
ncbi:MAG: hypothetical protein IT363_04645 [Methanoregulaceae archaeon]|nr:hypothetical protein [Methanoregulaceae archaeon]